MDNKDINSVLDTFENGEIKRFALKCVETIPEYWYSVPASSTGKYHPAFSLGDGGLVRHTIAVIRLLNHMFSIDCVKNQYTSRERDLLRVAALMHDSRKSGSQEEYKNSKWTRFDHPLLASNEIARVGNDYEWEMTIDEAKLIRRVIESHMGQWNTDKRNPDVALPTPQDKYQIILHLADYLASRKDIELLFDKQQKESKHKQDAQPDIYTWRLPFGKYSGMTLLEVKNMNPGYIEWLKSNIDSEPCHSLVMQL